MPECLVLEDAQNELRWLQEHAIRKSEEANHGRPPDPIHWRPRLAQSCDLRARRVPLQYILGSEYFGDIGIVCRPGVLIPRPETAATTTFLASQLIRNRNTLPSTVSVLDLCTGTGCIPLLLRHLLTCSTSSNDLPLPALHLLGVDISRAAVKLARENEQRLANLSGVLHPQGNTIRFERADILSKLDTSTAIPSLHTLLNRLDTPNWDILISNPPYISRRSFLRTTARSVRRWEPRLALVPPQAKEDETADDEQGDLFYPRLLQIAQEVDAKIVLMEVADMEQGLRVARMAAAAGIWSGVEIWRDGNLHASGQPVQSFLTRGEGDGRAVLCWRDGAKDWMGLV